MQRTGIGRRDFLSKTGSLTAASLAFLNTRAFGLRAAAAESNSLPVVKTVNGSGNTSLTMQTLLKDMGFMADFGLDAQTLNVADGTKIIGSLLSGQEDICLFSGFNQVLAAIEKGAKLKLIAGATLLVEQTIYSSKPDIHTLKDLEGRVVGTGSVGAVEHQLVIALMRKKNVDVSKVTFVNIGTTSNIFRAVAAGVVDAGPAEIDVYDEQDKYGVHSLTDANFWTELPEFTYQGSYTSDQAIAEKRDILVRTLAAYGKLYRFVSGPSSKEAYVKASLSALGNNDPGKAVSGWQTIQKQQPLAVNLVLSPERIRFVQDLNIETGVQRRLLSFEEVADMSIAQDALALLG